MAGRLAMALGLSGFPLVFLVWAGACYWHGVGGVVFNSSSTSFCVLSCSHWPLR